MEFEPLFRKLTPKMKAIAFKLNRGFHSLDEKDLFQEAAVFLWERFSAGELAGKTDSYILQGCYFHLQNHIRLSKDRISRVSIDESRDAGDRGLEERISRDDVPGFLETLDSRLLAGIITNNGLTDKEKRLLPLLSEGLTTRQIGERLGVSHVSIVKMKKLIGEKCRKYLDE